MLRSSPPAERRRVQAAQAESEREPIASAHSLGHALGMDPIKVLAEAILPLVEREAERLEGVAAGTPHPTTLSPMSLAATRATVQKEFDTANGAATRARELANQVRALASA